MYPMRDTAERKKRKKQESGPSHSKEKVTTVEELTDIKRARVSLSPVGVDNPNVTECLQLYFKCRCDDVEAWKQLQEKAENDEVAKAFVCDVLVHNEVFYRVSKDIEKAQHISKDIHYWIAATETDNNPTTHATKMYISGICLAQGIGIPKNQARAAKSIEEAAALGHCLAQYYVGAWYRDGCRVTKNMETAVQYFQLAAAQGHPIAQNMLGLCYATGQGVAADHAAAEKQYRLAAEQGLQIAQSNLESVLARGSPASGPSSVKQSQGGGSSGSSGSSGGGRSSSSHAKKVTFT